MGLNFKPIVLNIGLNMSVDSRISVCISDYIDHNVSLLPMYVTLRDCLDFLQGRFCRIAK
jgi:hypothetical protein